VQPPRVTIGIHGEASKTEAVAMVDFADRREAGRVLAERLEQLRGRDAVVLGLPRGGVPVAFEVATTLDLPLDVIVVRKLGVPFQPELAMGAIGEGGFRVVDPDLIRRAGITPQELDEVERRERKVLDTRVARFRRGRERVALAGRVAVVVDDGVATGSTARVACEVARHLGAAKVLLAVPVAPVETLRDKAGADEIVCVSTPQPFLAVGHHYRDFSPTSDDDVVFLLDAAGRRLRSGHAAGPDCDLEVEIPTTGPTLQGHLQLPEKPTGVVVFAHGSGSSRHSQRNRFVASVLFEAGLGTLLMDLLTPSEERDRNNVFDIGLLANRLVAATVWLRGRPDTASSRIGFFGASTGAAAALVASAAPATEVAAVVSRGGRPDLAGVLLGDVTAPTLLIVGSADDVVLDLNRQALARLRDPCRLAIVEGATHLFEEPGTLAEAAILARDWFARYLQQRDAPRIPERER
jgi:putative phosphoribosyl transferase